MFKTMLVAIATTLGFATATGAAQAAPGIAAFDGQVAANASGDAYTQAAGHPYSASTTIAFNLKNDSHGKPIADGEVKDVKVDLPAGLVGNPAAAATCTESQLENGGAFFPDCPAASQVGVARFDLDSDLLGVSAVPVFNMEPPYGVAGQFGMNVGSIAIVHLQATARTTGDFGLTINIKNVNQTMTIKSTAVELWGVPAAPEHDPQRLEACFLGGVCTFGNLPAGVAPKAFLTLPTSCAGPLRTDLSADWWQNPGSFQEASFTSHLPPAYPAPATEWGPPQGVTGCDKVPFDPSVDVRPTTNVADAPAGLNVDLTFPQAGLINPDGLATAHLKRAVVTLPEGMTINPAGADGLGACSDAQLGLGAETAIACPESSKVGTVTATTPLLKEQLSGAVYLRSQASGDPESGDMFRIAVVLENKERGLSIRLPGTIRADHTTGRLVTTFDNNPQLPVSAINLTLNSGPRAPLATPSTCGPKTVDTLLTSWAGNDVERHNTFDIGCTAGLGGFTPSFTAGTRDPVAGAFSPFSLSITKPDGDTALSGVAMQLPNGLLAQVKGNLNTQVGTVKVYAGPGSNPFMLPGQVYLEGPYGDAPFSLRVVVPAKAGPFDLGTVTVRQKIYVDPIDAHVTVVADPLPTIVSGVPVRLQRVDVEVDKPGFIINPTSCAAKTITGTLSAADGQSVPVTDRFQVGSCSDLALKPSLALTLSGKGQTTDGKHPAVTADLAQKPGQANLKKVRVALPLSLALDPDNANGLCEYADGTKSTPTCPKNSIVGTATATTPILDEPLSGSVYFVKNVRKDPKSGREIRTLPKLVIPLVGQNGVKLTLTGASNVVDDQLVTTFDNIPDAPVSSFKLSIIGGQGGILTVSGTDICKATQVAEQQIDGQNNKNADADVYIQTPSCPLRVISKKVGKTSVAVKVGGLGAGRVTVTGRGIKKTTKTISKAAVATITARRTKGTPGKVTVSFDPTGPAKTHKTTK